MNMQKCLLVFLVSCTLTVVAVTGAQAEGTVKLFFDRPGEELVLDLHKVIEICFYLSGEETVLVKLTRRAGLRDTSTYYFNFNKLVYLAWDDDDNIKVTFETPAARP